MDIRKYRNEDKEDIFTLFRLNTPMYFSSIEEASLVYFLENESDNFKWLNG
jgi:hypothetical protein